MSNTILGPDGQPLTLATRRPTEGEMLSKVDQEAVEEEVRKRVKAMGTTLSSVWDRHRGKPKPTPITFDTLRMMAHRNEWVRAIIKTRKNQIGKAEWSFQPPDEGDTVGPALKKLITRMETLFKRPSLHGSRPSGRSWRQFIQEVLEDLLVLDAGCIEKEFNSAGWIVAMYPVDGATIRPNIDERGGFMDDAFVQIVEGQVTARFGIEQLTYMMDNPMTDVRFAGYGYSPLESLIVSVTAELYASKYNASYFEKGSVPEGLLNLGEDASDDDVAAFRLYWMNEVMGKPWTIPIVGGKGVEWTPWRASNKDMEYMQYQSWLLKKMCAVYQIAPQEIGELEDVNRTTANDQGETNDEKSTQPIRACIKDYIDLEIVGEYGLGVGDYLEWTWVEEGENQEKIIEKYTAMIPMGAATRKEFRSEMGMEDNEEDAVGAEGLGMFLADGQPQPLPSSEDVQHMGAAAEQQQQAEQMEQQGLQSNGPGTVPWKPANPNDPDFQRAKQQHSDGQGLGPINDDGPVRKRLEDRNPAMTERVDDLEAVFERAHDKLIMGLADILHVPAATVEEVVG